MNIISLAKAVDLGSQYGFGDLGGSGSTNAVGSLFGRLVGPAFIIAGIAVLIYFLIGAFRYLVSGGDKNAVANARSMITQSMVGFILLILMFLILNYIPEALNLKINFIK
jgi:hypothetical protein